MLRLSPNCSQPRRLAYFTTRVSRTHHSLFAEDIALRSSGTQTTPNCLSTSKAAQKSSFSHFKCSFPQFQINFGAERASVIFSPPYKSTRRVHLALRTASHWASAAAPTKTTWTTQPSNSTSELSGRLFGLVRLSCSETIVFGCSGWQ